MATSTFTNTMKMNHDMLKKFDKVLSQSVPLKNTMAHSDSYRSATKDDINNLKKVLNLNGQWYFNASAIKLIRNLGTKKVNEKHKIVLFLFL